MADVLARMRAICAELPAVHEKPHFGDVMFTAGGNAFAKRPAATTLTKKPAPKPAKKR